LQKDIGLRNNFMRSLFYRATRSNSGIKKVAAKVVALVTSDPDEELLETALEADLPSALYFMLQDVGIGRRVTKLSLYYTIYLYDLYSLLDGSSLNIRVVSLEERRYREGSGIFSGLHHQQRPYPPFGGSVHSPPIHPGAGHPPPQGGQRTRYPGAAGHPYRCPGKLFTGNYFKQFA